MKLNNLISIKLLLIIFVLFCLTNKGFANKKNFVIATVDRVPITYIDLKERAKLIYFLKNRKNDYKNLKSYYHISLKKLISDKLLISKATEFNDQIEQLTKKDANEYILSRYQNSSEVLEKFLKENSISKEIYISNIQIEIIKKFLIGKMFEKEYEDYLKEINKSFNIKKKLDEIDLEQIIVNSKVSNLKLINKIDNQIYNLSDLGYSFKEIANIISKNKDVQISAGRSGWQNISNFNPDAFKKLFKLPEGKIIREKSNKKLNYIRIIGKRSKGKPSKREQVTDLIRINFLNQNKKSLILNSILKVNSNLSCKDIYFKLGKLNKIKTSYNKINLMDLSEKILNIIQNTDVKKFTKPLILNQESILFYICDKTQLQKKQPDRVLYEKKILEKVNTLTRKIIKMLKKDAIIVIKIKINEL